MIIERLLEEGARVNAHDPQAMHESDTLMILTEWNPYRSGETPYDPASCVDRSFGESHRQESDRGPQAHAAWGCGDDLRGYPEAYKAFGVSPFCGYRDWG